MMFPEASHPRPCAELQSAPALQLLNCLPQAFWHCVSTAAGVKDTQRTEAGKSGPLNLSLSCLLALEQALQLGQRHSPGRLVAGTGEALSHNRQFANYSTPHSSGAPTLVALDGHTAGRPEAGPGGTLSHCSGDSAHKAVVHAPWFPLMGTPLAGLRQGACRASSTRNAATGATPRMALNCAAGCPKLSPPLRLCQPRRLGRGHGPVLVLNCSLLRLCQLSRPGRATVLSWSWAVSPAKAVSAQQTGTGPRSCVAPELSSC